MTEQSKSPELRLNDIGSKLKMLVQKQLQELRKSEDDIRTKDLKFQKIKSIYESECDKINNQIKEIKHWDIECENMVNMLDEELVSNKQIQQEIMKKQKVKPSSNDIHRLECGQEKFNLYKTLTGIRWDFRCIGESVNGVIINKKNYLHAFSYSEDTKNINNKIWEEIYESIKDNEPYTLEAGRESNCS